MRFTVQFEPYVNSAVRAAECRMGLKHLDAARAKIGQEVRPGMMPERSEGLETNPVIELTEAQARLSGLFVNVNSVEVTVPQASLNKYTSLSYDLSGFDAANNVVIVQCVLDEGQIKKDWIAVGYPGKWNIPEETDE